MAAAKVAAGEAAYTAARTALQLHGAIGYTEEYDLSLWLRKARAAAGRLGHPGRVPRPRPHRLMTGACPRGPDRANGSDRETRHRRHPAQNPPAPPERPEAKAEPDVEAAQQPELPVPP